MTDQARTGEQPAGRETADRSGSTPLPQVEVADDVDTGADLVTQDDGSGMAGGSSGGSGGGSSMPGHPDAAR